MDIQSNNMRESMLHDLVEQLRLRLQALKRARVAGSKLASIVGQLLPTGKTFRDLLPEDVDRDTASFRVFVERNLAAIVTLTAERRGTDLLYNIVDSGQEIEPEPGDLWRAFVSVKPNQQLLLDCKSLSLIAVAPTSENLFTHTPVPPVSLAEHKDVCVNYSKQLKLRNIQVPQLDEILEAYTAASYTKWLKILRSHTPPLDREWGEFRKKAMLDVFEARLHALDIDQSQISQILNQLTNDAPRTAHAPTQLGEVTPVAPPGNETAEDQARRHLHLVIDRMTLEQMNALLIPFSLFPTGTR